MSRYAVYVKILVSADSKKEAREVVEAELEETARFESADIQNVKEVESDDDNEEDDDNDLDIDL